MQTDLNELVASALKLNDADRLRVVEQLLESLPDEPLSQFDEAFRAELDARYEEFVRDGEVGIPWSELKTQEQVGAVATTVIFHRLASAEYLKARRWYARRNFKVAERFVTGVDQAVRAIADAADSWPIWEGTYRWIRVRRFPYLLFFRILDDERVLVMAVRLHGRRRPGYWKRRWGKP